MEDVIELVENANHKEHVIWHTEGRSHQDITSLKSRNYFKWIGSVEHIRSGDTSIINIIIFFTQIVIQIINTMM